MKKRFFSLILFTLLTIFTFASETVKIQFLQTSDLHGKFMPYEYSIASESSKGSVAQLSTLVSNLKKENKNTVLFDNGDLIQDNSHELFLKEPITPMILGLNHMGYDAIIAGNHEFNFGFDTLNHVMKPFKGDFLVGNLYKNGQRVYKPYTIFKKEGVKVALIGVVTPHIKKWDSINLKDYEVTNPVIEVKKIIKEIGNKADIIVVSAHMPLDFEYGMGDSARAIAEENPEVMAVFAGHEHALKNERTPSGTVLIEPGKWGEYLAKVVITPTKINGKWVINDRNKDIIAENIPVKGVEPDKKLVAKLDKFHKKAIADASILIGELKGGNLVRNSDIKGIPVAQLEPTPMVDLINEVQTYYTNADVSSAAVFRDDANILEGPIKKSDVSLIYKYDNTLRAYRMNGAQLKKYMEWSVSYYNTFKPGDLTISFNENIRSYNYDIFSGILYEINISKPAGSRITHLRKIDGTPVKESDSFVVAVNDYRGKSTLVAEKDGLFKPGEIELVVDLFEAMGDKGRIRDLIREYIINVKGGIVTPEVQNNWKITGYSWNEEQHQQVADLVNSGKLEIPKSEDGRTSNVRSITINDIKNIK